MGIFARIMCLWAQSTPSYSTVMRCLCPSRPRDLTQNSSHTLVCRVLNRNNDLPER